MTKLDMLMARETVLREIELTVDKDYVMFNKESLVEMMFGSEYESGISYE